MATTLEQDLTTIATLEEGLANNKVAQFAYTQNAYNQNLVNGTDVYNVNQENNIPTADASIMKVNETVLSKGYRSQASSITRMLLNHFLGRVSYNLNKANDLIKSLVTTIKNNLGQANGLATLDANGRIPYSQLPETALEFKGMWNANTNTPELKDGSGERTKGDFYICNVAGTANFGTSQSPRTVTFFENDRVIYDGSLWQRLSAGDVKTVNNVQPENGNVQLAPSDIGLGNVDNTSDADKPVSQAQQEAISQAEANAKNLANATGKLDIAHGGTNATTTDGARTNLNINNVVNTGDSATPLANGTTKFTTGGAYAELLKKSNAYEAITIADLSPYTAYNDVPLIYLLDSIQNNFPRYGKCGIAKFAEETAYLYVTFDEPNNLRLRTSGLLIIGVVGFPKAETSSSPSNDSVVLLVTKDLAVYTCRCTRNGSTGTTRSVAVQSQSSLIFDSTPTDNSSNPVTSSGIYNAIKSAVEALDVNSAGGAGKYIESISETDGKISATAQTMDTTPTANSNKAVTSGGVKTAIDNKLPSVVNTGDSAVPEQDGNLKFTTGGAYNFFQTSGFITWLGRVFSRIIGYFWSSSYTGQLNDVAYFDGKYFRIVDGVLRYSEDLVTWYELWGEDHNGDQCDLDDYTWIKFGSGDGVIGDTVLPNKYINGNNDYLFVCSQNAGIWFLHKGEYVLFQCAGSEQALAYLGTYLNVRYNTATSGFYAIDSSLRLVEVCATTPDDTEWYTVVINDGDHYPPLDGVNAIEFKGATAYFATDTGIYKGYETVNLVQAGNFTKIKRGFDQYGNELWYAWRKDTGKLYSSSDGTTWSELSTQPFSLELSSGDDLLFIEYIKDSFHQEGIWLFGYNIPSASRVYFIKGGGSIFSEIDDLSDSGLNISNMTYLNGVLAVGVTHLSGGQSARKSGVYINHQENDRPDGGYSYLPEPKFSRTENHDSDFTLVKGVGGVFFASTASGYRISSYKETDLYLEDN